MPTYLYKCDECENEFEEIHRIAERKLPVDKICGTCGKGKISTTTGTTYKQSIS